MGEPYIHSSVTEFAQHGFNVFAIDPNYNELN